jgi:hypothetical protein
VTTEVAKPGKRGRETAFDMVRSLGLIAVITAVTLIFVPGLFHPSKSQRFQAVDYTSYVVGFRQVTGHSALVPRKLPSGWAANAGQLTGSPSVEHLHIGWATPGSDYAGLEQSNGSLPLLVSEVLGRAGATATGTVSIAGVSWQTRTSTRGEYSLSRQAGPVAVVITGSAADAQLRALAASLHPAPADEKLD